MQSSSANFPKGPLTAAVDTFQFNRVNQSVFILIGQNQRTIFSTRLHFNTL